MNSQNARLKYLLGHAVLNAALIIVSLGILAPIAYIFVTSLKLFRDIVSGSLVFTPTFVNYRNLFTSSTSNFTNLTVNSLIAASLTAVVVIALSALAAYSLTRYKWPLWAKGLVVGWLLFVHMLPPVIYITPYYLLSRQIGIYNTPFALVMAYTILNLPIGFVMMQNFFAEIPREIEEAALIDGCGRFQAFWRVSLPLVRTGIAATAILIFIFSWKDFLFALSLTSSELGSTIPVGIANFVQQYNIRYGEMAAGSFFAMLPALVLVVIAQQHIVRGLTVGAVRG
jgi:multiple sugar transport system permease protein